jgi:tRNA(fMet)-specific endonuclease VapC
MAGRFILDTSIIIALFNKDKDIHSHIIFADEIYIPCIAVGELYYGAYKSTKAAINLRQINRFVLQNTVLSCDTKTAKIYGDIKNSLKKIGKPIPENDIWIAALAKLHSLVLVTRDTHFSVIEGLETRDWV